QPWAGGRNPFGIRRSGDVGNGKSRLPQSKAWRRPRNARPSPPGKLDSLSITPGTKNGTRQVFVPNRIVASSNANRSSSHAFLLKRCSFPSHVRHGALRCFRVALG